MLAVPLSLPDRRICRRRSATPPRRPSAAADAQSWIPAPAPCPATAARPGASMNRTLRAALSSGVREDGDDVSPARLRLRLDPFGYRAVGQNADLAGDVQQPRPLGHLDGMAIGAERRGHCVRGVADVHVSRSVKSAALRRFVEYG